jgi:hypothetical protein
MCERFFATAPRPVQDTAPSTHSDVDYGGLLQSRRRHSSLGYLLFDQLRAPSFERSHRMSACRGARGSQEQALREASARTAAACEGRTFV